MPGYVIHLSIAKEYMKKHEGLIKDSKIFLKGTIMPDILPKPNSHYRDDTTKLRLDWYLDENDMSNDYNKGYFLHLLTDFFFYEKYLNNFEWKPDIYDDYDKLNKRLIDDYKVNIPDEISSIVKFKDEPLKILDYNSIKHFIEVVSSIDLDKCIKHKNFNKLFNKK